MGFARIHQSSLFPLSLVLLFVFPSTSRSDGAAALPLSSVVYKGCSKQVFSDSSAESSAVPALLDSLVSHSNATLFFKTTSVFGQTTITGLFQCRGDLSLNDCYSCVEQLPVLADRLCGKATAVRVQLVGCHILYETSGFDRVSGLALLYKICGTANGGGSEFEEKRDEALAALEYATLANGFYSDRGRSSMNVLGQCEGDLGSSDCADCIKTAVQKAQTECGNTNSAQIYLHKCFISYESPNRISKNSGSSSSWPPSPAGSGKDTEKKVAIVIGIVAAVAFVVSCCLCARNLMKKHEDF